MNIGFSATNPIGRKSCGTWTGTFGAAGCKDTKVDNTGSESVYPSGAGLRCQPDREAAASTGMIIHQDLLLPDLGQPIGD